MTEICGEPTAGDFTLSYAGRTWRYTHDLKMLQDSDPGVDWALQWANTP
jgi:hypothetical protein